jgi:hypothetical protein
MEVIWDTLFAVATATAIHFGVVSLAAHVNQAQAPCTAGIESSKQVGMMPSGRLLSGVSRIDDQRTSQFD